MHFKVIMVKSGTFGHHVNLEIHLQTLEIQMRWVLMRRLIRVFTICFVNLFFIPIIKIHMYEANKVAVQIKLTVRMYLTLPYDIMFYLCDRITTVKNEKRIPSRIP